MPIPISSSAPIALSRLATKLHEVIEQSLRTVDDEKSYADDVDWAISQLDSILERLEPHARLADLNLGRPGDPEQGRPFYVSGVLVGPQHPMFMPVELETLDNVTRGRVVLDIVWEGPPNHVHGGFIAHLFDCVMGQHNLNVGIAGMTGTLTVRYRRPIPLHTELSFEIRTVESTERKITTEAKLFANSALAAEAQGLFIVPANFAANLERDSTG
ncbi:MAG: PaaI family thioesterase [Myxococcota bacterium]